MTLEFVTIEGEETPYVVNTVTGTRYHLVPLPSEAPDPISIYSHRVIKSTNLKRSGQIMNAAITQIIPIY